MWLLIRLRDLCCWWLGNVLVRLLILLILIFYFFFFVIDLIVNIARIDLYGWVVAFFVVPILPLLVDKAVSFVIFFCFFHLVVFIV